MRLAIIMTMRSGVERGDVGLLFLNYVCYITCLYICLKKKKKKEKKKKKKKSEDFHNFIEFGYSVFEGMWLCFD